MLVKDEAGNLNVTHFAIEDGSFAKNVYTLDLADIFQKFVENVVGSST